MIPREVLFWARVNKNGPNGCWLWTGNKTSKGYGRILVKNSIHKYVRAHRFSYELLVGELPSGLQLDHLCHNPGCVNPEHLQVVTSKENTLRGNGLAAKEAKLTHCPKGHLYNLLNTYFEKRNGKIIARRCRICRRAGRENKIRA